MKKSIHLVCFMFLLCLSACQSNEDAVEVAKEKWAFVEHTDSLHYVVVSVKPIADQGEAATNEVQQLREDLNAFLQLDETAKLRLSLIYFEQTEGVKEPLLVIRRFQNLETANQYRLMLEEKMSTNPQVEAILPIAQMNYRAVLREKSLESYQSYFKNQLSGLRQ